MADRPARTPRGAAVVDIVLVMVVLVPVVFGILQVALVLFAFWPGVVGLSLTTP